MNLNLEAKDDNEIAIKAYLEENASEALAEKINSGKKTMQGCIGYVREQARKKARNGMAMIRDVEVFGWAVHYFEEDDLKEEKTVGHDVAPKIPRPIVEKKAPEPKKKETKNEQLDGQLDMFSLMGGM